jgi:HD-GYP domain-containing protein (c-di-GMP phosphodiesterase class II)
LNEEEFNVIKGHSKKGHDILAPLEQLASCLPGILHHHERVDGKGYPHGLKGEEIPFLARIIAVADTFDAITSNRAYRPAKAAEKALAVIKEVAGTQLDPKVVKAFKEVFETTLKAEFETSHDE